ncbi:MAG: hypothetical protein ACRD07_03975 [Acidimicrobiales bacterium]
MQHDDRDDDNPGHADRPPAVGGRARDRRRAAYLAAAVLLLAYAWWVVALAPFSGRATAAVVLAGAAAMAVGARERRRTRSPSTGAMAGIATWAALAATAGAWQLAAYLQHPRADHPTLSSLANEVLDSHLARAAAFVVWIAAVRGLARR